MKEITIIFRSADDLGSFAALANRQPFSLYLRQDDKLLDARSILNLSCVGLRRPLTLLLDRSAAKDPFLSALCRYLPDCVEGKAG